MAIEAILNGLTNVVKSGKNWRAPCPVHDGKDRNLVVFDNADGSVGCYCHVCGATGLAVVDAISVPRKELWPADNGYERPVFTREMKITEAQDQLVAAMADNRPWDSLTLADKRRVRLAKSRLESFDEMRSRAE